MALRVIWQYMDRSVTKKILYGPNLVIWQYMDRSVTQKILYGPKRGPYNIFLVTDRSIYCHMTRSDMNYLLYYTFYPK